MVPPPENVRMNSVNFRNILQWESPASPKGNLTFTAQHLSYRNFQDTCTSTALLECDFSNLSKYGDHTLRVRAELADEYSDWVNITFCPVDDTIIGPPGMQVEALANSLHIRFLAPKIAKEHETWTMRNIYNSWVYNVQYWKNGSDEKSVLSMTLRSSEILSHGQLTVFKFKGFLLIETNPGNGVRLSVSRPSMTFLGHPHHSKLLFFSFPLSDESEVFDKLSVITEVSESSQKPVDGCSLRAPSGQDLPSC
uniref:Interleukin 10 receptor, beta (Predicted) n=1 Tax=Rhinolophus ferrumequinum TaxID=59479 RepID=B2B9A4_RHIFE|nr:interleukin 10 receptor, beta (predicted) [Rhinolophus ferrumequinum]